MADSLEQLTEQLRFWKHRRNELAAELERAKESIIVTQDQIDELQKKRAAPPAP